MSLVLIVIAVLALAGVGFYIVSGRRQLPPPDSLKELPGSASGTATPTAKPSEPRAADVTVGVRGSLPEAPPIEGSPGVSTTGTERPSAEARPVSATDLPPVVTTDRPPGLSPEVSDAAPRTTQTAATVDHGGEAAANHGAQTAATDVQRHRRDVATLKKGLVQVRGGWMQKLFAVFGGKTDINPEILEAIEETLLTGDVGAPTAKRMVDGLRARLGRHEASDAERVWEALREDTRAILDVQAPPFGAHSGEGPLVILVVGVNGAGKTTTIAKLAAKFKDQGQSVLLAAADTFRAAAVTQIEMWGRRVGVPVHKGKEGARPATVVYEAVAQAAAEKIQVVIADTAGRLQTKAPLMEELRKIRDACGKASPGAPHEILLVLDATTGQNAMSQAKEFRDTLAVTGVVLTKLDGTAKGGVILAVTDEFKLPVRFIGVGEKSDDLREFDARDFVDALFSRTAEDVAA